MRRLAICLAGKVEEGGALAEQARMELKYLGAFLQSQEWGIKVIVDPDDVASVQSASAVIKGFGSESIAWALIEDEPFLHREIDPSNAGAILRALRPRYGDYDLVVVLKNQAQLEGMLTGVAEILNVATPRASRTAWTVDFGTRSIAAVPFSSEP